MQLGSMFISNCNITIILYTIWLSAEAIDLGRPYWILHTVSCHTSEAVTTVFKCSWGWTQKASETCRVLLQLLINILPSRITLVIYIYYLSLFVSPILSPSLPFFSLSLSSFIFLPLFSRFLYFSSFPHLSLCLLYPLAFCTSSFHSFSFQHPI